MSYDLTKTTKLSALKALAEKISANYTTLTDYNTLKDNVDSLESTVSGIVATGGEANIIETVKVNGTALSVTDKAVDVSVPTNVSELINDSGFQTATEVSSAIQTAIAGTGHATFEVAESVPDAADAEENVLYLVMNSETGYYDIYALVSGSVLLIDDTSVDLTNYVTKEDGKGLSTNDYTDDEKNKLASVEEGANNYTHPTYTEFASGLYKITVDSTGHVSAAVNVTSSDIEGLGVAITDTTYSEATTTTTGLMSASDKEKLDGIEFATDDEVEEMLVEVFGSDSE